jgi:hypothetical protein
MRQDAMRQDAKRLQEDQQDKRQGTKKTRDRRKRRNRNSKSDGKHASEYKLVFGNICSKFAILNFLFCEKVSLSEDVENK